jgi:predicted transcriptional regulator
MENQRDLVRMAAEIAAAYVSANPVQAQDIPALIRTVHGALLEVAGVTVTADYIICLEDGKKFKSLKRHLRTRYSMTPDEYRAKWGLAHDYPMVAPNYAKERSNLAKRMGLGQTRKGGEGKKSYK